MARYLYLCQHAKCRYLQYIDVDIYSIDMARYLYLCQHAKCSWCQSLPGVVIIYPSSQARQPSRRESSTFSRLRNTTGAPLLPCYLGTDADLVKLSALSYLCRILPILYCFQFLDNFKSLTETPVAGTQEVRQWSVSTCWSRHNIVLVLVTSAASLPAPAHWPRVWRYYSSHRSFASAALEILYLMIPCYLVAMEIQFLSKREINVCVCVFCQSLLPSTHP